MTLQEALTQQYRKTTRWNMVIDPFDGEQLCLTDLARKYNMSPSTLNTRIRKGLNLSEAIAKPINKRLARNHDRV